MGIPVTDFERTVAAVRGMTARYAGLLREVPGPSRNAIGHWSIMDTAVHTSHAFSFPSRLMDGDLSPMKDHTQMSETWDRLVAEDADRDMAALASKVEASAEAFLDRATKDNWTEQVVWHGGLKVPVFALASILLTEGEMHGRDIALASHIPWTISRGHGVLMLEGLSAVMPHYLDPAQAQGLEASFAVHLRGGRVIYFLVSGGQLEVSTDRPSTVDCRISADPVTYLLVGYGRISQWAPLLTGKIVAYGRKPWLGLRFAKLFYSI
jgi:uncharacterized protein (TIGR03083 family)